MLVLLMLMLTGAAGGTGGTVVGVAANWKLGFRKY